MPEDPLDQLMSATLAMEGNDATGRRSEPSFGAPPPAPQPAIVAEPARERVDYLWHDKSRESEMLCSATLARGSEGRPAEDEWLTLEKSSANSARANDAILVLLAKREPRSIDEVGELYAEHLDQCRGRLLCLVRGALRLSVDPVAELRATLSAITHFLPNDMRLRQTCAAAQEALALPFELPPAIAASHKQRIDEALEVGSHGEEATRATAVARACIESRAFARCRVFGDHLLRGMLEVDGAAVPTYLSAAAADFLPLTHSHRLRAIVEVRPSQDAEEEHPLAFRVMALGRELTEGR